MRKYFIINYLLIISFSILVSFQCSSRKIELQSAQSQNVGFLIEQAKLFFEQRIDSSSVFKANHFLGLANNIEKDNFELSNLYSRSLFFQGLFLENDKIKKDSLFLKGAEIAKYSVLNDSLFK